MTSIIVAENIELGIQDTRYKIQDTNFSLHLLGKFNIENALAATCVGLSEEISLEIVKRALEKIKLIPGRMENVPNEKGINIIIDYAVTPDSLEKLYELVQKIKNNVIPAKAGIQQLKTGFRVKPGMTASKPVLQH